MLLAASAVALAVLYLPLVTTHNPSPMGSAVQSELTSIVTALKAFYADNGRWPSDITDVSHFDNAVAMSVLTLRRVTDESTKYNPRSIKYLEPQNGLSKNGEYLDPWRNPYHISIDLDYDNQIEIGGRVISNTVAAWSSGPNGINEHGDGDDIATWE